MKWLLSGLSSTVGQKVLMGLTGLALCGFLTVHLAGNFLLYVGPEAYNHYAHALHSREALIKVAEAGLVALFGLHIFLALKLSRDNRAARPVRYLVKKSKLPYQKSAGNAERWMLVSGLVILAFLVLHLIDFHFEARTDLDYSGREPYDKAVMILRNPISAAVYLVGSIILMFHLWHGVASAFQSLGLSHPKYTPWIQCFGAVFAIVVAMGFASFVAWQFVDQAAISNVAS